MSKQSFTSQALALSLFSVLALGAGCSGKSTPSTPKPTPTPQGTAQDVLYLSGVSSGTCNDVKAYALPGLTSLGSFDVTGLCAGAFTADRSGNLYAMETGTGSTGYVYEFALGTTTSSQSQSGLCFPTVPGNGFIAFDDSSTTFYIAACNASSYDIVNQYRVANASPLRTLAEPNGNKTGLLTWPRIALDGSANPWIGFNANDSSISSITPAKAFVTARFDKSTSSTTPSFKSAAQAPTAAIVHDPAGNMWILHQFLPGYSIAPAAYYFKPGACTYDSSSSVSGDDVRYLLAQEYSGSTLTAELFGSPNSDGTGGLHDENTVDMAVDGAGTQYVSYAAGAESEYGVLVYDQANGANGPDGVPVRCPDLAHTIVQTTAGNSSLGIDSANNLYVSNGTAGTVTQYAPGGQSQTGQVTGFAAFAANTDEVGQILVRTVYVSAAAAAAQRSGLQHR